MVSVDRELIARVVGVGLAIALVLSGSGEASSSGKLPNGWWKGTVTVQERWSLLRTYGPGTASVEGSARLVVDLAERRGGYFDLEYRLEVRVVDPGPGEDRCRGKLIERWTVSAKRKRASLESRVRHWDPQGAAFQIISGIDFPPRAVREFFDDCTAETPTRTEEDSLPYFNGPEFLSKQPDEVTRRNGSAVETGVGFFSPVFAEYRAGDKVPAAGVNRKATKWDLTLVPVTTAQKAPAPRTAGPPVGLKQVSSSTFAPEIYPAWRPGAKVSHTLKPLILVDAAGNTVARGGNRAGCDLTYFYKTGTKTVTLQRTAARGTWAGGRLVCKWQLPNSGPVAEAARGKNVHTGIAPWVRYQGKRYWVVDAEPHWLNTASWRQR